MSVLISDLVSIVPYQQTSEQVRRDIAMLMHRVWPDQSPPSMDEVVPDEHNPVFDALSCFVYRDNRLLSYAAVLHLTLNHAGQTFCMAALSCVATDPTYQRQGLSRLVVNAATRWIENSLIDIGLFTCDPPLAMFYAKAGWPTVLDVALIGSQDAGALSSKELGKVVLLRLLSKHAHEHATAFTGTTISLGLPLGQFV
ncbi:GNAT family N-acetyltransferase [Iodobacter sp. CM08]|uniref:GNAT family N-acetyltransferase n=1 Tax=Iodobacter sp. CM08 TaxID=3085902 RepID=UPI0029829117|nr:GNAT family N-acetyltransferase [Iodobacter sp. CM08]MDW5418155.1 GNAT family N-acetyltransferase [Iodobacter sp. CM08]